MRIVSKHHVYKSNKKEKKVIIGFGSPAKATTALNFFAPEVSCLEFPAWDCLPYDRVAPLGSIVGKRLNCLGQLIDKSRGETGDVVITLTSAILQRIPGAEMLRKTTLLLELGSQIEPTTLAKVLEHAGFTRTDTVMETGEYAVRGGSVDVFPATSELPFRLDFFGNELDTLRRFDPDSQRTLAKEIKLGNLYL